MVCVFHENDDISRIMPGKKDCDTVKIENGDKIAIYKTYLVQFKRST